MADFKVRKVFTQSGPSLAVVIPKDYAEILGLMDGSRVYFFLQEDILVIKKVPELDTNSIEIKELEVPQIERA